MSEREKIVAWLREKMLLIGSFGEMSEYAEGLDAGVRSFDELIDAIERGEHLAEIDSLQETG